jgi:hypothetical protein
VKAVVDPFPDPVSWTIWLETGSLESVFALPSIVLLVKVAVLLVPSRVAETLGRE